MKKVSIIGQGYVGLTISMFASEHYEVIGFDTNIELVNSLNKAQSHIEGISNPTLEKRVNSGKYRATFNGADLTGSDVVIIAVPTPLDENRDPELKFIRMACETISRHIDKPVLIINESTSYPGTLRDLIKPLIEEKNLGINHMYAVSPERVDPGRTDYNQANTPRLIAGLTKEAEERAKDFYGKFCKHLVVVSTPEVAEAAKLFENTFRQVNIALVNEFAQICNKLGVSVYETLEAASTKPYGFMKFLPGAGVGGHCIPVDPTYLAKSAEEKGVSAKFIRLSNEVNLKMPEYIVNRVISDHNEKIKGKKIKIVGVSYKANIADTRETPAAQIINLLRTAGGIVTWHDDLVANWREEKSSELGKSDICIVITKHSYLDEDSILECAPYVFDTTGQINTPYKL